ncbi:hypothetical protein [Xanthomonas sacchari]|uniref:hypothetical protein n=1 Tax=Xanthomonas sacchari TaxID=56458 RepID=UPI0022594ACE|nr:hypothetical protein [Xanthomonas sacchari]
MKRQSHPDYLRDCIASWERIVAAAHAVRAERNAEGSVPLSDRIAMAGVIQDCEAWLAYYQRELVISLGRARHGHRVQASRVA